MNDSKLTFYYDPEDRYRPSEPEYVEDEGDEGELADRLYDEWQDEQAIAYYCQNQN